MILEDLLHEPAPSLRVERVRDAIGFHGLRWEWNALHARSGENPFLSWDWMQGHWVKVAPGRRPLVLVARTAAGELAGLLPLSIRREGVTRIASFLADETVGSDYLDALVDPRHAGAIRRALWSEALSLAGAAYDALELREMLRDSESVALVREIAARRALFFEELQGYRCPFIAIGNDFAAYLKRVPRSENLRRRRKQLMAEPGFDIHVARTPEEVGPALEEFFRLHALRWQSDGGSQGITGPRIEAFHRAAVRRFAERGEVRLYTLRVKEKALASVYMLGSGAVRCFYQSGYDPAHAKQSPGLVLLARTIEDAFAERAEVYDFLHGAEPYKFEWATGERQTLSLRLVVPTIRGRLWEAERAAVSQARAVGQRLLGDGGYEALRRLRRRWARS